MNTPMQRVGPHEAKDLIDRQGYSYLDVRSVGEFELGHPAGAYNVPLVFLSPDGTRENREFLLQVSARFERGARLVVGCASGVRSLRAAQLLEANGYTHVVDQRAGMEGAKDPFGRVLEPGWRAAGLPLSLVAEPGHSYAEIAARVLA